MNLNTTIKFNSRQIRNLVVVPFVFAWMICQSLFAFAQNGIWQDVEKSEMKGTGKNEIVPGKFRSLSMDMKALKSYLAQAPVESENGNYAKNFYFTFPMPDGTNQKFWIVESPVMAEGLASRYPVIKTYGGQGVDDPTATVRFDYTPFGFHAMILSNYGSYFIDPYFFNETTYYISYDKKDFVKSIPIPACSTPQDEEIDGSFDHQEVKKNFEPSHGPVVNKSIGTQLKTYDLALACTGEYAATKGGTVTGALAGMVTSINRVDGIYEREVAIRMVLIANTDTLIFLVSNSDPYTNNNGSAMLNQNQTTVTSRIGSVHYDIGHVFSTGGGGIAFKGCVCISTNKSKGVTGSPSPVGDAFDVDYVAHEMGHQFDANHTFNCQSNGCSGNISTSAAYEPGSGSTIMAYAGLCSPNDLQSHSDPIFHTKSFDEITTYTTQPHSGFYCAVVTATGNTAPVINPGANYIIPYSTPFKLTGSAFDADGDTITYAWEEYDLGPAGNWNTPTGNAPLFRSFNPTLSPTRLFPKLANILANNQIIGEFKPNYARTMNFKLTCRDNRFGGGGVTNNDIPVNIQVINTGTPFAITSPNTTGITYNSVSLETVTWNVGATDVAPISTPNVNIYLSIDGGQTFPIPLATNVPNTGSYQWWTPLIATSTARIWVEGAGNAFFDINDKNFSITGAVGINENELSNSINVYPNPGSGLFNFAMENDYTGQVEVTVFDKMGKVVSKQLFNKNAKLVNCKLDMEHAGSGIYAVEFKLSEGKITKRLIKL